jgi:hypothetical protein
MKCWRIEGDKVMRHGMAVATVRRGRNALAWEGLGMERTGFDTETQLLEDVKYFYRYRPPKLTLTFQSGRKVVFP